MKKVVLIGAMIGAFSAQAEETSIVDMAVQNGIKGCKSYLKETADFIIKGNVHSTHATWNKKDSDNRMYATLTSKGYSDGESHVTVVAAPTAAGKCDTTYVETFAMPNSCLTVREETFKGWKYTGSMNGKTILLANEDGSVNVYLSPQGNDICLVSKREVLYPM